MSLWLRLYTEVVNDAKVQLLPDNIFRTWINLLCIAKEHDQNGELPPRRDMAFKLRLSEDELADQIGILIDEGLIENGQILAVHGWDNRQCQSDTDPTAAERKRRQREREQGKQRKSDQESGQEKPQETPENVTRDITRDASVPSPVTSHIGHAYREEKRREDKNREENSPPIAPQGALEEAFADDPEPVQGSQPAEWTRPDVDRLLELWDSLKLPPFRRRLANISTADSGPVFQALIGFSPHEAEQAMRNFAAIYHDRERYKAWNIPTPLTFLAKHIGPHLDQARPFEQFARNESGDAKLAAAMAAIEAAG